MASVNRKWHELGPFTVFDLETTGLSPRNHRIVEIAAARISTAGTMRNFQSLVNPGCHIPGRSSRIHNITDDMVRDAPCFREVGPEFAQFAKDSTLVAHNARFDLSFLQESLYREGLPLWEGKTMDSIVIVKKAYPGHPSYSLQYLRRAFGLGAGMDGPAHRAFADIEWTLEIFGMSMQRILEMAS